MKMMAKQIPINRILKSAARVFSDADVRPDDNLTGIVPRLPHITIDHERARFVLPDNVKCKSFDGVVLRFNNVNAWWPSSARKNGHGKGPDCWSLEGEKPVEGCRSPQSDFCAACKWNEHGSGEGRSKACKNTRRLQVLVAGDYAPCRLVLPPTSLRYADGYLTLLTLKALPYCGVMTRFNLERETNGNGKRYAVVRMRKVELITDAGEARRVLALREMFAGA